jgi:hypothetical protein
MPFRDPGRRYWFNPDGDTPITNYIIFSFIIVVSAAIVIFLVLGLIHIFK